MAIGLGALLARSGSKLWPACTLDTPSVVSGVGAMAHRNILRYALVFSRCFGSDAQVSPSSDAISTRSKYLTSCTPFDHCSLQVVDLLQRVVEGLQFLQRAGAEQLSTCKIRMTLRLDADRRMKNTRAMSEPAHVAANFSFSSLRRVASPIRGFGETDDPRLAPSPVDPAQGAVCRFAFAFCHGGGLILCPTT